jgi:hypothetical protein
MNVEKLPPNHVLVIFGDGIPSEAKGPALLAFEVALRSYGADAEVFLETMRDQNKLRRDLTREDVI